MRAFHPDEFIIEISTKLNEFVVSDDDQPHRDFERFLQIFSDTMGKHAPLRKRSRKERKLLNKP